MNYILEKKYCTGCEACANVCTHHAIDMVSDREGFDYPIINQSKCIDCGLCTKVCPVIHYEDENKIQRRHAYNNVQKAIACKINDEKLRGISSSGGIFPALARHILNQEGIVVGAAFDDTFNVYHKIIASVDQLKDIQSSKYAQSKIGSIYKEIKRELTTGKMVLFAGMACQVEGLKSYLQKDYSNLFTIDLICMGIPSPGVWRIYLDTFFKDEHIKNINFKDKTYGWRTFSMRIETDRRTFLQKGFDNVFFQCMFRHYTLRPSCFNCPFKKVERLSDFTLADCWGTVDEVPQLDDNKGLSSVIVHSSKGLNLWKSISQDLEQAEVTIDSIARNNDNLVRNRQSNIPRSKFYAMLSCSPRKAMSKYGKAPNSGIKLRLKSLIRRIKSKLLG